MTLFVERAVLVISVFAPVMKCLRQANLMREVQTQ